MSELSPIINGTPLNNSSSSVDRVEASKQLQIEVSKFNLEVEKEKDRVAPKSEAFKKVLEKLAK